MQMAGLMLYLNDENYLYAYVTQDEEQGKVIRLMRCADDAFTVIPDMIPVNAGEAVQLAVEVRGIRGRFYGRFSPGQDWVPLFEEQDIRFLCGGFTGNFVGIAVHDMQSFGGSYADFSHFRYTGIEA